VADYIKLKVISAEIVPLKKLNTGIAKILLKTMNPAYFVRIADAIKTSKPKITVSCEN